MLAAERGGKDRPPEAAAEEGPEVAGRGESEASEEPERRFGIFDGGGGWGMPRAGEKGVTGEVEPPPPRGLGTSPEGGGWGMPPAAGRKDRKSVV